MPVEGAEICAELAGMELVVDIEAGDSLATGRELVRWAGDAGDIVMALSGLSRCPESGPNPKRINARESGTVLLCHP